MPYILQQDREIFAETLEAIISRGLSEKDPSLDFYNIVANIITSFCDKHKFQYALINETIGVLACINMEFERRIGRIVSFSGDDAFMDEKISEDKLAENLGALCRVAGDVNYVISVLINQWVIKEQELDSFEVGDALYSMFCIFYLSLAGPYEDTVKDNNGDVYEIPKKDAA